MLININKKVILNENTDERKLTRIPILAATGAVLHPTLSSAVEQVFNDDPDLSQDTLIGKALLGGAIGTGIGTINYFRKDDPIGMGPIGKATNLLYPIKK